MALHHFEYLVVSPGSRDYQAYLALRHAVFCEELKRVTPSGEQADGLAIETDEFDVHSLHILCRARDTKTLLACSRLILPSPKGLNVSARYALNPNVLCGVPLAHAGEIGRLTLSPVLRRSRSSVSIVGGEGYVEAAGGVTLPEPSKRDGSLVALGLYRELFRLMSLYGISHCFAAMEPALARLLTRIGFPFIPAGVPRADAQSPRYPYLIGLHAARAVLAGRNSSLYDFMTTGDGVDGEVALRDWPTGCRRPTTLPYLGSGAPV